MRGVAETPARWAAQVSLLWAAATVSQWAPASATCLADITKANVTVGGWPLSVSPYEDLADGAEGTVPCRAAHNGYAGSIGLTCAAGSLAADGAACVRALCPLPNRFMQPAAPVPTFLAVDGLDGDIGSPMWSDFVLMSDGRMVSAPTFASQALVVSQAGQVRTFGDGGTNMLKYFATVVVPGSAMAYGIPYFADQAMVIDADQETADLFGPTFGDGGSKWYGGAYASGAVWGIPYNYPQVLRIDADTSEVTLVGDDFTALGTGKWWEAVVVGDVVIGIPANAEAVLFLNTTSGSVVTFGGPFGQTTSKWRGSVLVPGTDKVYAMPYNHGQVLKVRALSQTATLIGPDLGAGAAKWRSAVMAGDGRIFAVPYGASQVLRVDPGTDEVLAFADLGAAAQKWSSAVLSVDGFVMGFPGNAATLLRVDPGSLQFSLTYLSLPSTMAGPLKWTGAVVALDGTAFAPPGSAPAVLRVGGPSCLVPPSPVSVTCVLGQPCNVTLQGSSLRAGLNLLAVLSAGRCGWGGAVAVLATFGAWINPPVAQAAGANATSFALGAANSGTLLLQGRYRLCWGDNPGSINAFDQEAGFLTLLGPLPSDANCTMGRPCVVDIVAGRGLLAADQVAVLSTLLGSPIALLATARGLVNPASGATPYRFALGTPLAGPPGSYALRWRRGGTSLADWVFRLGVLALRGPMSVGNITCSLGRSCTFSVAGVGLGAGDRVALLRLPARCDNAWSPGNWSRVGGWCGANASTCPPSLVSDIGDLVVYYFGIGSSYSDDGSLPRFALCWESGQPRSGGQLATFAVELGVVTVLGPVVQATRQCMVGRNCSVWLRGYNLSSLDTISIVGDGPCWSPDGTVGQLADLGIAANPVSVTNASTIAGQDLLLFQLGIAQKGAPALYRLCWTPGGNLPPGQVPVDIGPLDLLEDSCWALKPQDAAAVSCTEGVKILHRGSCTTRCNDGFDPSVATLSCFLGAFTPPTFQCRRRCRVLPVVANAGSQTQCYDTAHGAACPLACPAGYVASGDLVCSNGNFSHRSSPNLTYHLVYDVPQCYPPCSRSVFPVMPGTSTGALSCSTDAPSVPHGGTCATNCLAGSSGFDAQGAVPIPSLECRGGAFYPDNFTCLPFCQPPTIAFAGDLSACANTPHGRTCALVCQPLYTKSGDLSCNRGTFSTARCLRPCDLRALLPQGAPYTLPQLCSNAGEGLVLLHNTTCIPACQSKCSNLDEASFSVCQDGALVPPSFRCHRDCLVPPPLELVAGSRDLSAVCTGLRHSERCPLLCQDGYTVFGDVLCLEGQFVTGTCRRNCNSLPPVVEAMLLDSCYGTKHGQTCPIRCQDSYTWTGDPLCYDGVWEAANLCLPPCRPALLPKPAAHAAEAFCAEGAVIPYNGTCTYQCATGFTTDAVAICVGTVFRPATYSCRPLPGYTCAAAPSSPGLAPADAATCVGLNHNEVCDIGCLPRFTKVAPLTCTLGTWNDPCQAQPRRCGSLPPLVPNGAVTQNCTDLAGSWCPVVCKAGFEFAGATGYTCLATERWTENVTCVRSSCGRPPEVPNGNRTCNGATVSDRCEVTCAPGFLGGGSLECYERNASSQAGGTWSWRAVPLLPGGSTDPASVCTPRPCGPAPFVPGLFTHSCDGIASGTACRDFACTEPLQGSGQFACMQGQWVQLPRCTLNALVALDDVPAVAFTLGVDLNASWGEIPVNTSWGQRASDLVGRALRGALVAADSPIAEVVLLGWSASQFVGRRLANAGVHLDYVVSVACKNSTNGTVAGAGIVQAAVARVEALSPTVLGYFLAGQPKLLAAGGPVDVRFASIGRPFESRVPLPSTSTPPPTATATTTSRATSTTTRPATTTSTTPVPAAPSLTAQLVANVPIVIALALSAAVACGICVLCVYWRERNKRLVIWLQGLPRKIKKRPPPDLLKGPPAPDMSGMTLETLAAMTTEISLRHADAAQIDTKASDKEGRMAMVKSSAGGEVPGKHDTEDGHRRRREMGRQRDRRQRRTNQHEIEERMRAQVSKARRQRAKLHANFVEGRAQDMEEDYSESSDEGQWDVEEEEAHVEGALHRILQQRGAPADLAFQARAQALKPLEKLPEDFVQLSVDHHGFARSGRGVQYKDTDGEGDGSPKGVKVNRRMSVGINPLPVASRRPVFQFTVGEETSLDFSQVISRGQKKDDWTGEGKKGEKAARKAADHATGEGRRRQSGYANVWMQATPDRDRV